MNQPVELFKKKYDGESICDVDRDVSEAFSSVMNPLMEQVPDDEHGMSQGTFTVTITWTPPE